MSTLTLANRHCFSGSGCWNTKSFYCSRLSALWTLKTGTAFIAGLGRRDKPSWAKSDAHDEPNGSTDRSEVAGMTLHNEVISYMDKAHVTPDLQTRPSQHSVYIGSGSNTDPPRNPHRLAGTFVDWLWLKQPPAQTAFCTLPFGDTG